MSADSAPDQDGPPSDEPERVTVTLAPKARRQLAALGATTKLSRTDLVNRAVNLYAMVHNRVDEEAGTCFLSFTYPDGGHPRDAWHETVHLP